MSNASGFGSCALEGGSLSTAAESTRVSLSDR
ncbi:MAG: hypothetical protein QOF86_3231, partial [Baekduia sp.]|nr:hypothetical protein [Baekduia sp.]